MIKIFTTQKEYNDYRIKAGHDSFGIVPTMGNLHEGHISLLRKSVEDNRVSVITIFVNPKQFGPAEDFEKYPRTLDADLSKISTVAMQAGPDKEIVVFAPSHSKEIYPPGYSTNIHISGITEKLEGKIRPTHFDGVATVVYRLFKIINATNAYFGQKDYQQCLVVKQMVMDLGLNITIHVMPIVRNAEGLALSSRNQYLSEQERIEALHLSRTLKNIEQMILNKEDYQSLIDSELINPNWDYLEVLNANTLETPNSQTDSFVILGVFRLGSTRLLDNIVVKTL